MKKNKVAFITGVTGQDGSYLAELLLEKGLYSSWTITKNKCLNVERIQEIINKYEKIGKLNIHYMDLTDTSSISNLIIKYKPDEFYNLAAMSHVGISFYTGEATLNINTLASYSILESILKHHKKCKFYQASSSEMFGSTPHLKMKKVLLIHKVPMVFQKFLLSILQNILDRLMDLFASNGILFNHESPRRGLNFVTRKITHSLARILSGYEKKINLGDISTRRDWGIQRIT